MPKFKVYGGYDAYAVHSTIIEADNAEEARKIAEGDDIKWHDEDETDVFDDFTIFTEEGSVVELGEDEPNDPTAAAVAGRIKPMTSHEHHMLIEASRSGVILEITHRQRNTILAALRLWQRFLSHPHEFSRLGVEHSELLDIAINGGAHGDLNTEDIDGLCEELNQ